MYRAVITLTIKIFLINLISPGSALKLHVILYILENINIRVRKNIFYCDEIEEYTTFSEVGFFLILIFWKIMLLFCSPCYLLLPYCIE